MGPGALRLLRKWVLPWIFITTITSLACAANWEEEKAAWRGICHGRLNVYKRNIHPDAVISTEIGTWCFSVGTTSAEKLACCTARSSPRFRRRSDLQSVLLEFINTTLSIKTLIPQDYWILDSDWSEGARYFHITARLGRSFRLERCFFSNSSHTEIRLLRNRFKK